MADFYPTKTRLALLQAVADGEVSIDRWSASVPTWDRGPGTPIRYRIVKDRMRAFTLAGWTQLGERDEYGRRYYELTDAGRKVLTETKG
jgi:hypothetical protein